MRPPGLQTVSSEGCIQEQCRATQVAFVFHTRGGSRTRSELRSGIPEDGMVRASAEAYPCNRPLLTPGKAFTAGTNAYLYPSESKHDE